ncbi:hypothetical protein ACXWTF_05065 [Thiomicrolovo sp. ZZH C-3]
MQKLGHDKNGKISNKRKKVLISLAIAALVTYIVFFYKSILFVLFLIYAILSYVFTDANDSHIYEYHETPCENRVFVSQENLALIKNIGPSAMDEPYYTVTNLSFESDEEFQKQGTYNFFKKIKVYPPGSRFGVLSFFNVEHRGFGRIGGEPLSHYLVKSLDDNQTAWIIGSDFNSELCEFTKPGEHYFSHDVFANFVRDNYEGVKVQKDYRIRLHNDSDWIYPEKPMVINGFVLPPKPNQAFSDYTLSGVDTNKNKVRDDIERAIFQPLGYFRRPVEQALAMQYAKTFFTIAEAPVATANSKVREQAHWNLYACLQYLEWVKHVQIRPNVEYMEMAYFNTPNRKKAYAEYNWAMSGGVYNIPLPRDGKAEYCEFNITKMLEMEK